MVLRVSGNEEAPDWHPDCTGDGADHGGSDQHWSWGSPPECTILYCSVLDFCSLLAGRGVHCYWSDEYTR
uniref:Uncharacterized protein n=1 Tax=Anguilla anguilla TaxID=7936 RepID=A0A0E9XGQ3_ANGAN